MKLRKLTVNKYKSIKTPQTIEFDGDAFQITLIGMNGSGKSNLLEAIYYFFNSDYRFIGAHRQRSVEAEYNVVFELNDDEMNQLELVVDHDRADRLLEVNFKYGQPSTRIVKYKPLTLSIKNDREKLVKLATQFKLAAKEYLAAIKSTEMSLQKGSGSPKRLIEIVKDDAPTFQYTSFSCDNMVRRLEEEMARINKAVSLFPDDGIINWDGQTSNRHDKLYSWLGSPTDYKFRVSIAANALSPLERKRLNISALQSDVDKLNHRIASQTQKIESALAEFIKVYDAILNKIELQENIVWERQEQDAEQYKSFLGKVHAAMFQKCYLLDNESSLMFGIRGGYEQRAYENPFLNLRNPIENAFNNYCVAHKIFDSETINGGLAKTSSEWREKYRSEFEKFINDNRPTFDKNQYEKMVVEIGENGQGFKIFVIEKNGDKVDINETSLGRRWFFTYWFIKNNMQRGDYLLLDEPAAFLHPQAQKEVLQDLQSLINNDINVIIATHSPYLLSDDLDSYYWVNMSRKQGTKIKKYTLADFDFAKKKLGLLEFGSMVLDGINIDPENTTLYVEGKGDAACFEKFFDIFGIDKEKYNIIPMGSADHADWWYEKRANVGKSQFIFFIDSDVRNKNGKSFSERKSIPSDKIVYVGNGENGSIESLFSATDKGKYFTSGKVNDKKIEVAVSFDPTTKNAFRELFKRAGVIM